MKTTSNVLPSVVDTSFTHSQACKPRSGADPCDVHGPVSDRIFPGEEALHNMQFSIPGSSIFNLL